MTLVGLLASVTSRLEGAAGGQPDVLWVRVGGGLEEVTSGRRHGPADRGFPPPEGPWAELSSNGRLVGWARPGTGERAAARRAQEEGERIRRERRARLTSRLGHKLRSSVLALQEAARQAAFGRQELLEQIYEQAQDVGRRGLALERVAVDQQDMARDVVIAAALGLAAGGARRRLPADAKVRVSEPVLVEGLRTAYEWMGGPETVITGAQAGAWWRLEIAEAPGRRPLAVPELGEPLVRHYVDTLLEGWLDASAPDRAVIYLPAS